MKLNYRLKKTNNDNTHDTHTIITLHGLFGDLHNLNRLATDLAQYYNVLQIDLRNHGLSPHSKNMNYTLMSTDILELLDRLMIKKCILIGHSMGGKVAMTLTKLTNLQQINKIVIIDIAPIKYCLNNNIFHIIDYINALNIHDKKDAIKIMQQCNIHKNIILFLLKSFNNGNWKFNFPSIKKNYPIINDWNDNKVWKGMALFIKGEHSPFIQKKYFLNIRQQFPFAHIHTILNTGHWLHYENPTYLFKIVHNFICD